MKVVVWLSRTRRSRPAFRRISTWLLAQLPARKRPVDIVAHGRGGLLARALVNDGRLPVRRVCQVGSPNHGTPLAREPLAWLNGHVALLAALPTQHSLPTLEGVLALMRSVALGAEAGLPGHRHRYARRLRDFESRNRTRRPSRGTPSARITRETPARSS